jgi:polysaccharide biosynthesis protein PelE
VISLWVKISTAMALEASALSLLTRSASLADLLGYFALHALASTVVALLAWALLPGNYKKPFVPACGLLWAFAFFIPGLGVAAILVVVQIARLFPRILRTSRFVAVRMPEFSGVQREATERSDLRAGDARRILKDATLPLETRLRVLVALQVMQPKAAVPLLMGLLSDPSEDIRLLAYSMVDTWEKDLVQKIQKAQQGLQSARQLDDRVPIINALRRLAELHWTQADTGLARGDLRRFALERSRELCEETLQLDPDVPGIWELYVNVLIELGDMEWAMRAVKLARQLNVSLAKVWPMAAHVAYLQRDFDAVRKYMARLPGDAFLPPSVARTAAYWRTRRVDRVDLLV